MKDLNPNQIKAVFFDLDATLLALPDDVFAIEYPKLLVNHFADLFDPGTFLHYFWKATEAIMQHNNHDQIVLESFFVPFSKLSGLNREEVWRRFQKFYSTDFAKLKNFIVDDNDDGIKLIKYLKSKNIPMILASNPVFPKIANEQRIHWAGLEWTDFVHVTHGENSYSSKPDPKYYLDLAKMVKIEPEHILMVGNSYYYDGFASKYGFKTFIYNKFASQDEFKDKTTIHGDGSLADLLEWFEN